MNNSDIKKLNEQLICAIQKFNMLRAKNLKVDEVASEIAALAIEIYQEIYPTYHSRETEGINKLNDKLSLELIDYITSELLNSQKLDMLCHKETNNLFGIANKGRLIFKYDYIDCYAYPEINEFLNSKNRRLAYKIGVIGIITKNAVAYDDKIYISNNPENFIVDYNMSYDSQKYKKMLYQDEYFICRVYDENGIKSVNYVHPNKNDNNNSFVGIIIKYSENIKEVLSYSKGEYVDNCHPYYPNDKIKIDVPTTLESRKTLKWRIVEKSTRLSKKMKTKSKILIKK